MQCGKCGQKKVSYSQAQTRSADEPMTTFCEYAPPFPPAIGFSYDIQMSCMWAPMEIFLKQTTRATKNWSWNGFCRSDKRYFGGHGSFIPAEDGSGSGLGRGVNIRDDFMLARTVLCNGSGGFSATSRVYFDRVSQPRWLGNSGITNGFWPACICLSACSITPPSPVHSRLIQGMATVPLPA